MEKIIIILIGIVFTGCTLEYSPEELNQLQDDEFNSKINKTEIYYNNDFNDLKTIEDIIFYMRSNIELRFEEVDTWSTAEETLSRGYGDCEDFAIVFMNIYYIVTGNKSDLVAVFYRDIVEGGNVNHAMVLLNDSIIISAQSGIEYSFLISYKYDFDLFFY